MSKKGLNLRHMMLAAMFVALLAIAGQIAIPLPIPITLQPLVVLLAGSVLGRRLGLTSMLVFILLAAFGAPILSGGKGGLGVLFGPTAGYIWSWPLVVYLVGWMTERKAPRLTFWSLSLYHFFGVILMYVCGVLWLCLGMGTDWGAALVTGVLPFIPGDLIKTFVASTVALSLYKSYPMIHPASSPSATE
ncbi:biotin transporter BioY [Paludifilum halophilum]|uniref:Biotin transporter n=1 Tax=Paludifilum halophilum TaxID=1642702 RepID=A0A235B9S0_9BACL|nr:biotin transporter BioY [Paludifilum halophilum]OYD09053.1 hypothetical protein CHM34_04600 [Paludifilum halophilum]